jgi:YVTN family beta-propeller protein
MHLPAHARFARALLFAVLCLPLAARTGHAQCGTGPMIVLDPTATYAYEGPSTVAPPYSSPLSNQLTIVGRVHSFCAPLDDQPASSPDSEYTVVMSGMSSLGTTQNSLGSTTFYITHYSNGTFWIYRHAPRTAYSSASQMPGSPPNATVPSIYQTGTLILTGNVIGFTVQVTKTGSGPAVGSYTSQFNFTGGTLISRMQSDALSPLNGSWCVTGCLPPAGGYSAQAGGNFNFALSIDTDRDGVPDGLDQCPTASAAGQDADADGCVDPTSTMHHVETWANTQLPIHVALPAAEMPGFTDGSDLAALRAAMQTWRNVPGAQVPLVEDTPTGQTTASAMDGINLITFGDSSYPFSPSVLAVTPTLSFVSRSTYRGRVVLPGEILDADMLFNPSVSFSTPTHPGDWDLQSVATHEFGHLLGLSHTGVRTATMFFVQQPGSIAATLKNDDMAAIAAAYPTSALLTNYGTIRGHVLSGSTGLPVPGALVTAVRVNADGYFPEDTVSSDYTREDGSYALFRLPPGNYGVHIQALDGTVLDGLTADFISQRLANIVQTGFDPEWYSSPETASDDPTVIQPIGVNAGALVTGIDIVTNVDTTPPVVTTVTPADGNGSVGIDGVIAFVFSEAIDPSTISSALRVHRDLSTTNLTGSGVVTNFGRTLLFTPDRLLDYGALYRITLTTGLTDAHGVPLAAPFNSSFTTGGEPAVSLTSVFPSVTPVGGIITLNGVGFVSGDVIQVHFTSGGPEQVATPSSASPGTIVVQVPAGVTPGADNVFFTVQSGGTTSSNTVQLTIVSPPAQSIPSALGSPIALPFTPTGVALSGDGALAYVVGSGGFVTISLDPASTSYRTPTPHFSQAAQQARLTPDGRLLLISQPGQNQMLMVDADPASGTLGTVRDTIPLPASPVDFAIDARGEYAYIANPANSQVWVADLRSGQPSTGEVIRTLSLASPLAGGVALHPGSGGLVLDGPIGLLALPLAGGSSSALSNASTTGPVAIDPAGVQVFAPASSGALATSSSNGAFAPALIPTGGQVRDVLMSRFGQSAYAVNGALNQLQVVNSDPGSGSFRTLVGQVPTGTGPVAGAISGNGALLAVANSGSPSLSLYATGEGGAPVLGAVLPPIALPGDQVAARNGAGASTGLSGAAVDLGGMLLPATRSLNEGLGFLVPALTQQQTSVTAQIPSGARSLSLPFTVVDPIVALTARPSGRSFTVSTTACSGTSETGAVVLMRGSPDGGLLAVLKTPSSCQNNIDLFEMSDAGTRGFGALDGTIQLPSGTSASEFAFTADGLQIWVALRNNTLHVYDASPSSTHFTQELGSITSGTIVGAPRSVAADPLGRRMIVGGTGIRFFRPDLSLEKTISGFTLAGSGIALSPDGHRAALGAAGRAYFVDVDRETLVSISPLHGGTGGNNVDRITMTTDGRRALGLFADGSVSVWTIDPALGALGAETYHGTPVGTGVRLQSPVPGVDGHSVLFGDGLGSDVVRLDLNSNPPGVTVVPTAAAASIVQRSADGRRLFAANASGSPLVAGLSYYNFSAATQMSLLSGANQTGAAGATLPLPVLVKLTDGTGHAQAGVVVRFDLTSAANGAFPGTATTRLEKVTDASGQAQTPWIMPASGTSALMSISALGVAGASISLAANVAVDSKLIAPVVVQFGPPNGASGINAGSAVSVLFNQAMTLSSLNSHLALSANGAPVPGTLSLQNQGMLGVFKPSAALPYSAHCTLTVRAGSSDTDGQVTSTDASSAFTIQDPPTVSLVSLSPPSGPPGASITINGTGFSATLLSNLVGFSGGSGVVTSGDLANLVATVPTSAVTGPVTVQVGPSTSNPLTFTVVPPNPKQKTGTLGSVQSSPGIRDIAVTPDGTRLYITNPANNSLVVFDVQTVAQIAEIPVGIQPQAVGILPDGSRAYVANTGSNDVSVVDIRPTSPTYHTVIKTIPVGPSPIDIEVSPIGPAVYVLCSGTGTVQVIDARPNNATFDQVTTTVNTGTGSTTIKIKPDGSTMYVTNSVGFEVVNLSTGAITNTVNLGSPGVSMDVSPDGSLALVLTQNGILSVVILTAGTQQYQVVTTVNTGTGSTSVKISPDGTLAYVTNGTGNTVLAFQISVTNSSAVTTSPPKQVSLILVATITVGQYPTALVFDPSGRPLGFVVNTASGTITLIGSPEGLPPAEVLLEVNPHDIDLKSECRWVPALIQPKPPYVASQIVLESLRLNGTVAADTCGPHQLGDANHDGVQDLVVSFPRKDLLKTLPSTPPLIVVATGNFSDQRRFTGRDTLKVHRGEVRCPDGGVTLTPGSTVQLCWDTPPNTSVQWVAVLHSFDHGECWELDDDLQPNTGTFSWTVPNVSADSVLVAVELIESSSPAPPGSGTPALMTAGTVALSQYFGVNGITAVDDAPSALSFARPVPNPAFGRVALRFGLPQRTHVKLEVYDIMGRRVRTLVDGTRAPGWYDLSWDGGLESGQKASAGLYFVRFEAQGRVFRERLSWLR